MLIVGRKMGLKLDGKVQSHRQHGTFAEECCCPLSLHFSVNLLLNNFCFISHRDLHSLSLVF